MSEQLENINEILSQHKLSQIDYHHIKEILGRSPNKADALRMTFAGSMGSFFDDCQFEDFPAGIKKTI